MKKQIFGMELLLDLYHCNQTTVNDLRVCYNFLEDAVKVIGVFKQSPPFIFQSPEEGPHGEDWFSKRGLSGWIPLIESGIQIHTLVAKNFISIDYYTCTFIDKELENSLKVFSMETFRPQSIEAKLIERGTKYFD